MNMNNLVIFPKFKKPEKTELEDQQDIELISRHYAVQFWEALQNHGIVPNASTVDDLEFLAGTMAAIMMRTLGKHHTIQDIMDDSYIPEIDGVLPDEFEMDDQE